MVRKIIRNLPCDITDDERRERGIRLADCISKIGALEAEKSDTQKRIYREKKPLEDERDALAEVVNTGVELREIECVEIIELKTRTVRIIRKDTNEKVDSRPMTEDDQQGDLPGVAAGAKS